MHRTHILTLSLAVTLALLSSCATPGALRIAPRHDAATGLLLIAHGHGNNPGDWPRRLIEAIESSMDNLDDWDIYAHDWEVEASKVLTASRSGWRIGRELARGVIADGDHYQVIHLVGQSLGAFVTQSFVEEYRAAGGRAVLHMTFLDPFLIRNIVGFGFGVRRFGRGADFAENYMVKSDPVPGTNRFLRHAFNWQIDALVPERFWDGRFGAHWWAVAYYRESVTNTNPGFGFSPMAAGAPGIDAAGRAQTLRDQFPPGGRRTVQ